MVWKKVESDELKSRIYLLLINNEKNISQAQKDLSDYCSEPTFYKRAEEMIDEGSLQDQYVERNRKVKADLSIYRDFLMKWTEDSLGTIKEAEKAIRKISPALNEMATADIDELDPFLDMQLYAASPEYFFGKAYLFCVEKNVEQIADDLNNKNVSNQLENKYREEGYPLSKNISVSVEKNGKYWTLKDKDEGYNYEIRKEEGRLNIYEILSKASLKEIKDKFEKQLAKGIRGYEDKTEAYLSPIFEKNSKRPLNETLDRLKQFPDPPLGLKVSRKELDVTFYDAFPLFLQGIVILLREGE